MMTKPDSMQVWPPHQHWACTECKRVEDMHWEAFEDIDIELPKETKEWGDISSKHLVFRGLSIQCPEKKRKKPSIGDVKPKASR